MKNHQAGKLMKAVCNYVFEDKLPECNDRIVKSNFILMKQMLDNEERDRLNGQRGGQKSAELRQAKLGIVMIDHNELTFNDYTNEAKKETDVVAKSSKNKAG